MLLMVVRRAINGVNIIPSNPPSLTAPAASSGFAVVVMIKAACVNVLAYHTANDKWQGGGRKPQHGSVS